MPIANAFTPIQTLDDKAKKTRLVKKLNATPERINVAQKNQFQSRSSK